MGVSHVLLPRIPPSGHRGLCCTGAIPDKDQGFSGGANVIFQVEDLQLQQQHYFQFFGLSLHTQQSAKNDS